MPGSALGVPVKASTSVSNIFVVQIVVHISMVIGLQDYHRPPWPRAIHTWEGVLWWW